MAKRGKNFTDIDFLAQANNLKFLTIRSMLSDGRQILIWHFLSQSVWTTLINENTRINDPKFQGKVNQIDFHRTCWFQCCKHVVTSSNISNWQKRIMSARKRLFMEKIQLAKFKEKVYALKALWRSRSIIYHLKSPMSSQLTLAFGHVYEAISKTQVHITLLTEGRIVFKVHFEQLTRHCELRSTQTFKTNKLSTSKSKKQHSLKLVSCLIGKYIIIASRDITILINNHEIAWSSILNLTHSFIG